MTGDQGTYPLAPLYVVGGRVSAVGWGRTGSVTTARVVEEVGVAPVEVVATAVGAGIPVDDDRGGAGRLRPPEQAPRIPDATARTAATRRIRPRLPRTAELYATAPAGRASLDGTVGR